METGNFSLWEAKRLDVEAGLYPGNAVEVHINRVQKSDGSRNFLG
jgi:hypothetical protein